LFETLVPGVGLDATPTGMQDGAVESGLLTDVLPGLIHGPFCTGGHVLDIEALGPGRVHQCLAGLVGEVIPDIGYLAIVTGNSLGGLSPVGGAILPTGKTLLPFLLALDGFAKAVLLLRGIIKATATGRSDRDCDAPVEPGGDLQKLRFG